MAQRTVLRPYKVITDGSMAGDLTSKVTVLQGLSEISYALSWSGTAPVGTIALQLSNDYSINPDGQVGNPGTWTSVTLSSNGGAVSSLPVSGNTGTLLIDPVSTASYAARLVYTRTSGTGSLQATISGKVK